MTEFLTSFVKIVHIFTCIVLIVAILLQAGKGGGMGAAFGGASQTMFGGSGGAPFLAKLTAGLATVFMLTSLTLAYFATHGPERAIAKKATMKMANDAKKIIDEVDATLKESDKLAGEALALLKGFKVTKKNKAKIEATQRQGTEVRDLVKGAKVQIKDAYKKVDEAKSKASIVLASDAKKKANDLKKQAESTKTKAEEAKKQAELITGKKAAASQPATRKAPAKRTVAKPAARNTKAAPRNRPATSKPAAPAKRAAPQPAPTSIPAKR